MVTENDVLHSARWGGQVKRYHTWPTLRQQSVGEHSWQVARIYREIWGCPRPVVWEYILLHDVGEIITGDIPFQSKARFPELKAAAKEAEQKAMIMVGAVPGVLTAQEERRVKFCDLMEMLEFSIEEMQMGNTLARPILDNIWNALITWNSSQDIEKTDKVQALHYWRKYDRHYKTTE